MRQDLINANAQNFCYHGGTCIKVKCKQFLMRSVQMAKLLSVPDLNINICCLISYVPRRNERRIQNVIALMLDHYSNKV